MESNKQEFSFRDAKKEGKCITNQQQNLDAVPATAAPDPDPILL
jgi:hypothetical protein